MPDTKPQESVEDFFDGLIAKDEARQAKMKAAIRDKIRAADADGDGVITASEMKAMGLDDDLLAADKDGDGLEAHELEAEVALQADIAMDEGAVFGNKLSMGDRAANWLEQQEEAIAEDADSDTSFDSAAPGPLPVDPLLSERHEHPKWWHGPRRKARTRRKKTTSTWTGTICSARTARWSSTSW